MKFNIIHIIICIFVFVGCTQQTVNNSVECFTKIVLLWKKSY